MTTRHRYRQAPSKCGICHEEKLKDEPTIICSQQDICLQCLTTMITRVVEDRDEYPVKLDYQSPFDFAGILDRKLFQQYKLKKELHHIPPAERVYCFCGRIAGRLVTPHPGEDYIAIKPCQGEDCDRHTCLRCATELKELGDIIDHDCATKRQAKEEDQQKMIDSDERGTKFQLCPTCARPIQLMDACHHMRCPCGTEFCYFCGNTALENSNHWREGGCPRYPDVVTAHGTASRNGQNNNAAVRPGAQDRIVQDRPGRRRIQPQVPVDSDSDDGEIIAFISMRGDGTPVPLPPARPEPSGTPLVRFTGPRSGMNRQPTYHRNPFLRGPRRSYGPAVPHQPAASDFRATQQSQEERNALHQENVSAHELEPSTPLPHPPFMPARFAAHPAPPFGFGHPPSREAPALPMPRPPVFQSPRFAPSNNLPPVHTEIQHSSPASTPPRISSRRFSGYPGHDPQGSLRMNMGGAAEADGQTPAEDWTWERSIYSREWNDNDNL